MRTVMPSLFQAWEYCFCVHIKNTNGSPKYRILSGLVLLSSVNLLAISVEIFLPISAPIPAKILPSAKPIAESADAPMATPLATPKSNVDFLIIDLPESPNDGLKLPDTVGAPKVLDCTIPYGSFLF